MDEQQVQVGKTWLAEVLKLSGLPSEVHAEMNEAELEPSCWLTIDPNHALSPEQVQALTEKGAALDALQYLANTTLNMGRENVGRENVGGENVARESDAAAVFTIELNGYRVQRQAQLQEMADSAAEKVRSSGKEFEMDALSSAERRQVHTYLKSFDDLDTYSRGREPDRRLVVRLASAQSASDPSGSSDLSDSSDPSD
jgi:spoIIIJ-associated protein